MRSSVIALFLVFSCLQAFAQGDLRDGYVVLINGDSIIGKVAYRHSIKNSLSCKFKPPSGEVITYTPTQVRAYGYFSDKRFESRVLPDDTVSGSPVFMEVVIKGYMSLLKLNNILYLELHDGNLVLLPEPADKTVRTDKGTHIRRDNRYKGLLNSHLSDCGLKSDRTDYDQTEIGYLVQNYNRCHHQPGIHYKETKPKSLFTYQAFGGIQASRLIRKADKKSMSSSVLPMAGISVDLSAPRIFDRIFLSAECIYSRQYFQVYEKVSTASGYTTSHYDTQVDQTMLKFPVGIRYNFFNDYQSLYVKGGVIYAMMLKWKIAEIREEETPTQVVTYNSMLKPEGAQTGFFGSVGYSHGIFNKLRAFVELRYERMKPSSSNMEIGYRNTSFYIFTGVRF